MVSPAWIIVPFRRTMGEDIGMLSSRVATRIVPCTGGQRRSVSRTTASRKGSPSIASACDCAEYPNIEDSEKGDPQKDREPNSLRRRAWISG